MARPTTFTKDMITDSALALVAKQGLGALSARNVAAALGSSTAPIYVAFESLDDLRAAVVDRAAALLRETTAKPWSDRPFLNEGVGLVVFARDNPQLFSLLFLTPDVSRTALPKVYAALLADMRKDARFAAFSPAERNLVLEKMWYQAVGMATLAHAGHLRDQTTQGVTTSLLEAGEVIIPDAVSRVKKARRD